MHDTSVKEHLAPSSHPNILTPDIMTDDNSSGIILHLQWNNAIRERKKERETGKTWEEAATTAADSKLCPCPDP